jgi:hypothetical protein
MAENIYIRLALKSVLYAPILAFIGNYIAKGKDFEFIIEIADEEIETGFWKNLNALTAIEYDPVFSPVIEIDKYLKDRYFAVGDPLRVRRLMLGKDLENFEYNFLGTLIQQLAFWIISENGKCSYNNEDVFKFNLVTCHSKGMTGYYLAETIFKLKKHDPLAPTKKPGNEVNIFEKLLELDMKERRLQDISKILNIDKEDPVWFAAISTEYSDVYSLASRRRKINNKEFISKKYLPKTFTSLQNNYCMTAIVARNSEENREIISSARNVLKDGIISEIKLLTSKSHQERKEFAIHLKDFFNHTPDEKLKLKESDSYSNLIEMLERSVDIPLELLKTITRIYPSNLITTIQTKNDTDKFIDMAISSDLNGQTNIRNLKKSCYDDLKTDTWNANELWS